MITKASSKKQSTENKQAPKKTVDKTNAEMKPMPEVADAPVESESTVDLGSTKKKVKALLNVYSDQATTEEKDIASSIIGFLGSMWTAITSIFKKKNKEQEPVNLNKEEVVAKLVELFQCSEDLAEVGADTALMARIMTEMPAAELNSTLDCLYTYVTDPNTLIEMIWVRFGVPVISDDQSTWDHLDKGVRARVEKGDYVPLAWSASGLAIVYQDYILLPQKDLDIIKCLFHKDDSSFGGAAYGTNIGTTGIYYVNYQKGNEARVEEYGKGGGHIDSKDDTRNNTKMMNMTVAHELGHIVDGNSGWKISGNGGTMREVSSWKQFSDDADTIVKEMSNSISGDLYDGKLSADEITLAKKTAKKYLVRDQDSYKGSWTTAATAIKADLKAVIKDAGSSADADSLAAVLTDKKIDTNLLYHIWRGQAANSAYYNYNDARRGTKRPFHQGYKGQEWFTFDPAKWSDKISCYQYRCPKEEFAETYASYHAAPTFGKKKGEITPKPLLDWFLGEGFGDVEPEGSGVAVDEKKENNE